MVWESNSRAIVMLTRCVEKGREKCDHYWPYDMQPQYYGEIQVVVLNQSQFPDWTVSEFKVMRGDSSRVVRHFHFTTWPDFGVPEPAQVSVSRGRRGRVGSGCVSETRLERARFHQKYGARKFVNRRRLPIEVPKVQYS